MTDTERLDFLLQFISSEDVGDDIVCPGVIVKGDDMCDALSSEPVANDQGRFKSICHFGDNLRDVIDRAIACQLNTIKKEDV